jgi:hypothetical protein
MQPIIIPNRFVKLKKTTQLQFETIKVLTIA